MAKAGSAYNELATKMAEALEPNAKVHMGKWVEGPDGKREVDVEVRSILEGRPFFLLIECKDWKSPVDIEEIDKLDSKGKDLSADRVMICSNSGFTKKALRKAGRLEMEAVSVLAADNKLIKLTFDRVFVAEALSVDHWSIALFPTEESLSLLPQKWDGRELYYGELPVVNWLHDTSAKLLREHEGAGRIVATFAFREATGFQLQSTAITLRGIQLQLACSRKWVSQTVKEDVTLGYYDWIRDRVTIPGGEYWTIGSFDQNSWEELSNEPEELRTELESNEIRLAMVLLKPIANRPELGAPQLDEVTGERSVIVG